MTDVKMPLTAHLEELRRRLIISIIAISVVFVATYNFSDYLFFFLTRPLLSVNSPNVQLIGTGVTEAFFTKLKVSFITGAAFCYYVVFPVGYQFFVEQYETIGVAPSIRISEYLSFTARMLLA